MTIIDQEYADLETPTGAMRTFVLRPAAPGRYPGLVLFSEIFQATGPIRRTAALLAGYGFVVAVPEIFHEFEPAGAVLAYDSAGAVAATGARSTSRSRRTTATRARSSRSCCSIRNATASSAPWASASAAT